MWKKLAWGFTIIGISFLIGVMIEGCHGQTVATRVATAPTLPGYIAPSSMTSKSPGKHLCPGGVAPVSSHPRRHLPDGTILPEDPMRGSSTLMRKVFSDEVIYCAVK